jgi:hypothetical protein
MASPIRGQGSGTVSMVATTSKARLLMKFIFAPCFWGRGHSGEPPFRATQALWGRGGGQNQSSVLPGPWGGGLWGCYFTLLHSFLATIRACPAGPGLWGPPSA